MAAIPSPTQLVAALRKALKRYHQPQNSADLLAALWSFKQFDFAAKNNVRETTNNLLRDLVAELELHDKLGAELLSRRFFDGEKMLTIANSLNISEATGYRRQSETIQQIAAILRHREETARQTHQARLRARLERPTYTQLIGFDRHIEALMALLTPAEPPWLVAVEGYGGTGKTSLAHQLAQQCIEQWLFDDIGWISARPHLFDMSGQIRPVAAPALTTDELVDGLIDQLLPDLASTTRRERLKQLAYRLNQGRLLIVIDNLETIEDLEALLPVLAELANPAKFLLTSRRRLAGVSPIYHFRLPELNQTDTLRLIRHEIERHNLTHLQAAADSELLEIYDVAGGNPLAVRLIVGQAHIFDLKTLLADLIKAHSQTVDELYTFIYWRAWQALDEQTRHLFLAMPLISNYGEAIEGLVELSELEATVVHTSLKQLVNLNLVNSIGDHQTRYYTIHNLTRSFLQEQVLKWKQ